jgi:hypothetical protein
VPVLSTSNALSNCPDPVWAQTAIAEAADRCLKCP